MATEIHFGTSGWRAVMADEFTFANVRRAVTGIARYVVSQKPADQAVHGPVASARTALAARMKAADE